MNKDLKQEILNKIDFRTFYKQHLKSLPEDISAEQITARCPFHHPDNNPSLSINLKTGLWHCFGCDAKGDVFKFYMDLYKVTFLQALHAIAKDLDIPIESKSTSLPLDVNAPQKCHDTLMSSPEFLESFKKKRGYTNKTIEKHKFGYSKERPVGFTIPIDDKDGKLVILKTRLLTDSPPKYLIAGGKAEVLYNHAEMLSKSDSPVMFVEGEFDVALLGQYGFLAVSSITGAQTFRKEWLIYFKGRTVIIILDADKAGRTAAQKIARMLLPVAKEVKIINLSLTRGNDVTDYFVSNTGTKEELEKIIKETEPEKLTEEIDHYEIEKNALPLCLPEFLELPIPPVEWWISALLPKKGRGLISGDAGRCKSILAQNFAVAMACGIPNVLNAFHISPAKVLYLDLEIGPSGVKERFEKMCAKYECVAKNLFLKSSLSGINLKDPEDIEKIKIWIKELKIDVLIIDPLGSAWVGKENNEDEMKALTTLMNQELIVKCGVSILATHNWKKPTPHAKTGPHMAAGSYALGKWLDYHVTIEGPNNDNLVITLVKQRHVASFERFRAKINLATACLEYVGDCKKVDKSPELLKLFHSFEMDRVAVPDFIKRAKDESICGKTIARDFINTTKDLYLDDSKKTHYLCKDKPAAKELF